MLGLWILKLIEKSLWMAFQLYDAILDGGSKEVLNQEENEQKQLKHMFVRL